MKKIYEPYYSQTGPVSQDFREKHEKLILNIETIPDAYPENNVWEEN